MRRALSLKLALQGMSMKVSANLVVQYVALRADPGHASFDTQQVIEFAFYGFIGSQVGNIVQYLLEDWFPTGGAPASTVEVLSATAVSSDNGGILNGSVRKEKRDDNLTATGAKAKARNFLRISPDLIWQNVLAKLLLDQTLGLAASGCVFLICTNIARVPHPLMVFDVIRDKIFPLIKAGWHIWPLVAVCNFLWVPLRSRVLVAVVVGFGWSVFLSIFAMRK